MSHRFDPVALREYDIRGIVGKTLGEADAYAIGQLKSARVSPDDTAGFFARMAAREAKLGSAAAAIGYVSSHPLSQSRERAFPPHPRARLAPARAPSPAGRRGPHRQWPAGCRTGLGACARTRSGLPGSPRPRRSCRNSPGRARSRRHRPSQAGTCREPAAVTDTTACHPTWSRPLAGIQLALIEPAGQQVVERGLVAVVLLLGVDHHDPQVRIELGEELPAGAAGRHAAAADDGDGGELAVAGGARAIITANTRDFARGEIAFFFPGYEIFPR